MEMELTLMSGPCGGRRQFLGHAQWTYVRGPAITSGITIRRVGVGIMRQHQLWVSYFTTIYRHRHFA